MILYSLAIFCGLLYICNGTVTTVRIQLVQAGGATANDKLSAKLGDRITVQCFYDAQPPVTQVVSLQYKATSSSEKKQVVVPASISEPWKLKPSEYAVSYEWRTKPYYMNFTITSTNMADAGEYICDVAELSSGNVGASASATLQVSADTELLVLDGIEGEQYLESERTSEIDVICTAYNGSQPAMKLIVGDMTKDFTVEAKPKKNLYEGTAAYLFTGADNGKKITCESKVAGYEPKTQTATLKIRAKPVIKCDADKRAKLEDKVTIECTISGSPLPLVTTVEWSVAKLGERLSANEEKKIFGLSTKTEKVDGVIKSRMTVIVNTESFDEYVVFATNDGGTQQKGVHIIKVTQSSATSDDGDGNDASSLTLLSSLLLTAIAGWLLL